MFVFTAGKEGAFKELATSWITDKAVEKTIGALLNTSTLKADELAKVLWSVYKISKSDALTADDHKVIGNYVAKVLDGSKALADFYTFMEETFSIDARVDYQTKEDAVKAIFERYKPEYKFED